MGNQSTSLLILFLILGIKLSGQTEALQKHNHIVFVEIGGPGGNGSMNYEYIFFTKANFRGAVRMGLSTYRITDFTGRFNPDILIPLGMDAFIGKKHSLVLGLGQTLSSAVSSNDAKVA